MPLGKADSPPACGPSRAMLGVEYHLPEVPVSIWNRGDLEPDRRRKKGKSGEIPARSRHCKGRVVGASSVTDFCLEDRTPGV